jgi:hypothetical protein
VISKDMEHAMPATLSQLAALGTTSNSRYLVSIQALCITSIVGITI